MRLRGNGFIRGSKTRVVCCAIKAINTCFIVLQMLGCTGYCFQLAVLAQAVITRE